MNAHVGGSMRAKFALLDEPPPAVGLAVAPELACKLRTAPSTRTVIE